MEVLIQKLKRKISLLFISVFIYGCNDIITVNYFLPEDFQGHVAIIYNNQFGQDKKKVVDYFIPKNGILILNHKMRIGNSYNFFLKKNHNHYDTLLSPKDWGKSRLSSEIYFHRVMSYYLKPNNEKTKVNVEMFYVGNEKGDEFHKSRSRFEKKIREIVNPQLSVE